MSFQHKMILIRVNKSAEKFGNELGRENITAEDLLTMTCSAWVLDDKRANQYPYAAAVIENKIVAVFEVRKWFRLPSPNADKSIIYDRCHFVGHTANPLISSLYVGKDVSDLYSSSQNPIHYVDI